MPSGRRLNVEVEQAKKAVADVITYHKDKIKFIGGKPSPLSVAKLIKEKYNIVVTRQFVHKVIAEGEYGRYVDTLCLEDNPKIIELKDAMLVQQSIWKNEAVSPKERTMASNAWRAMQKQLIDYERDIADIKIKETEAARPVYLIRFASPSVAVVCPSCGHLFYDVRDEDKVKAVVKEEKRLEKEKEERGEDWKPFYSKAEEKKNDEKVVEDNVQVSDDDATTE
jgi:hypothetical protein